MPSATTNGRGFFAFRPAPPLDFVLTLERYRLWGPDPASLYTNGALHRVARVGAQPVPFRLTASGAVGRPTVRVEFTGADTPATRAALRAEARRLLGLDADLAGFYAQAARDPVLAPLVQPLLGLRPSITPDPFEMLVGAISAQQVNLPFAFATRARLVQRFGVPYGIDGVTVYAFPAPAAVAAADVATLRAMQFSTRKAEYLIDLARALADGRLDLARLAEAPDEAVIECLTAQRGPGPLDGRVVPRPRPRASRRLPGRGPGGPARGGGALLPGPPLRHGARAPAGAGVAPVPEPGGSLSPGGAAAGPRPRILTWPTRRRAGGFR